MASLQKDKPKNQMKAKAVMMATNHLNNIMKIKKKTSGLTNNRVLLILKSRNRWKFIHFMLVLLLLKSLIQMRH